MYFPVVALLSIVGTALAAPVASAIEPAPKCTTTIPKFPHMDLSPTSTVYLTTVTAYNEVACNGCALETPYLHFGPGPVVIRTTTVTKAATTEYELRCQATSV